MNQPILQLENIELIPLQDVHYEPLQLILEKEPALWKYFLITEKTKDLQSFFKASMEEMSNGTAFPYLVRDQITHQVIGSTGFHKYNPTQKTIMLGFTWFSKDYRGTMVNKISKYLLLNFAFQQLGVDRVELWADTQNTISINALKSIGCTIEGVLRQNGISFYGRRDTIVFSMLKEEWFTKAQSTLGQKIGIRNELIY